MSYREPARSFRSMTAIAAEFPRICARIPLAALRVATGRSAATIRNWLEGRTEPKFTDVVAVMQFPEIADEVIRLAGHKTMTQSQLEAARAALKILEGS